MTSVDFEYEKSVLTAKLSGEIDHHGATKINHIIDDKLISCMPKVLVIDFTGVTFMDSSGVGLVLARNKFCRAMGISVYVQSVDRQSSKILALAGIKTIRK